jgi:putative SOS response-associated peptidase YedK
VPAWWKKSPKEVPATFTARAEAVADKPMFRTAFKERRCIVPASGFFECTGEKGAKQPHLFTAADGSPLLALRQHLGPLERSLHRRMDSLLHNHRSGAPVWIEPSHDRMPVLPEMTDFDGWLDGSLGPETLKPAPEGALPRVEGVAAARSHRRRRPRSDRSLSARRESASAEQILGYSRRRVHNARQSTRA